MSHSHSPRGAALVLVLSALALIAFLALAVLTLVRSEDRASRTVADVAELRTLQSLPEKLVISQIRTATKDLLKFENGFTWTSQPGMIRVFGTEPADGSPRAQVAEFYKLYSSNEMEVKRPDWNPLEEAQAMQGWQNNPSLWTDLNEPVVVRERREQYSPGTGNDSRLVYPIIDPRAAESGVEGFELTGQGPGKTRTNPLPMPVRWLYVLAEGQIVAPTSGGQNGSVTSIPGATADNPVVGRIAFWTDDESCKLNLNVAGSPAPWDRPVTTSTPDRAHAAAIPARGENYREPAHPAFTSLGPVLRRFGQKQGTPGTQTIQREPGDPLQAGQSWADSVRNIHELLPLTPRWDVSAHEGSRAGTQTPINEVQGKRERWFANVDEFFFSVREGANEGRARNGENRSLTVTQDDIEVSRFFLTTRSRAPETNPFGWPKISLWPVSEDPTARHQVDRKMTLAATLNAGGTPAPYYLQRAANWESEANPGSSQSATADMAIQRNVELFDYLKVMTDNLMPGVGGAFVDKYGETSRNQILTSMFDFLRWGVNPMSPYQQRLDDELNVEYSYLPPGMLNGNQNENGAFSAVPLQVEVDGAVSKGYGRFPTLSEVSIVLFATKAKHMDASSIDDQGFYKETQAFRAFFVVEPFVVAAGLPGISPAYRIRMKGHKGAFAEIGGMSKAISFPLNPNDPDEPNVWSPMARFCTSPVAAGVLGNHGAYSGMVPQFMQPDGRDARKWLEGSQSDDEEGSYFVFGSQEVDISDVTLSGSEHQEISLLSLGEPDPDDPSGPPVLLFEIYDDSSASINDEGALVQVLKVPLSSLNIPLPRLHKEGVGISGQSAVLEWSKETIDSRFKAGETTPGVAFLKKGDVVRSAQSKTIAPISTDIRLQAANGVVQSYFFEPVVPSILDPKLEPGWYQAHSLRDDAFMDEPLQAGFGATWDVGRDLGDAATAPSLVARGQSFETLKYGPKGRPAAPLGFKGAMNFDNRPGDFDNGPGVIEDGPYINMPELGNALTQESAGATSGGYFERGGSFFEDDGITFSPLRQMGSAVGFGSLPSAVFGDASQTVPRAWTTLLFCPHPPSRTTSEDKEPGYESGVTATAKKDHFGFGSPRDHLWLEFFWMPAVEPSGLSEGFSTEGKVNMNYQILPFSWINRATAMHGALEGVRITAIPSAAVLEAAGADHYKAYTAGSGSPLSFRYAVDATETLRQFESRFSRGEVFVSPSEICDQFLVPRRMDGHTYQSGTVNPAEPPQTAASLLEWWEGSSAGDPTDGFEATGDNAREAPYAQLYPRLCTRSNVFKVHYRVQVLQKAASTKPNVWDEQKDRIAADYRGEATIERYIDPARTDIEDFATVPTTDRSLDDYCDYRITGRRQFVP